ncbi:hypothetical protein ACFVS2_10280 [Brevibacillus sp. NPDC058079]|uniref:hypothetical protein n=1 Tax=Brevibacillus sp. NPDC058079 TaxID=3346330 RepID=UPI0036E5EBE1
MRGHGCIERIKLRVRGDITGEVFFTETEAELAFEIKGYRFFYHNGRITDALCGMTISVPKAFDTKDAFCDRVEQRLIHCFDEYLNRAKKRIKANWKRRSISA